MFIRFAYFPCNYSNINIIIQDKNIQFRTLPPLLESTEWCLLPESELSFNYNLDEIKPKNSYTSTCLYVVNENIIVFIYVNHLVK